MHYLLKNRGIVLSRDRIMQVVWGFDFEGESRTVDMHIKLLRQKLGKAGGQIKTCLLYTSRYDALASLEDIMPTLIELAGGEVPEGLDGLSLCPVMRGEQAGAHAFIHGEHSGGYLGNHFIVTGKDKYIWFDESGREQYFDLSLIHI